MSIKLGQAWKNNFIIATVEVIFTVSDVMNADGPLPEVSIKDVNGETRTQWKPSKSFLTHNEKIITSPLPFKNGDYILFEAFETNGLLLSSLLVQVCANDVCLEPVVVETPNGELLLCIYRFIFK